MKTIHVILCIAGLGLGVSSCKKDTGAGGAPGSYPYEIRMTDDPGPYSAVNIDLQGVEVTGSGGAAVSINVKAGIYNLLDFCNGMDTMIASGTLTTSNVSQIRLILGPNNTVVKNNVSHHLNTPSADQSGLKLQVHQSLQSGVLYSVLLDFDANKSVVLEGNGKYKLKPVIRTIETAISGSIKGKISVPGTLASVTATSSSGSYSSNVSSSGEFMLMGLPAGIYSVTISPAPPLNPIVKINVMVSIGISTDMGVIIL
jgi:hypothetical protein